jgi:hypothetical protein
MQRMRRICAICSSRASSRAKVRNSLEAQLGRGGYASVLFLLPGRSSGYCAIVISELLDITHALADMKGMCGM